MILSGADNAKHLLRAGRIIGHAVTKIGLVEILPNIN